jgi:uncharacterized protein YciI
MLVSIYCKDVPNSDVPRQSYLNDHLQHIEIIMEKIKVAGPVMDEGSNNVTGSLLVLEVNTLAEAEQLMQRDPYYGAGVWDDVSIQPFLGVAGDWVGGKNW